MTEEHQKRQERERAAMVKYHETPGWHLLQVSKYPAPGCGKPLYCEKHQYAYGKWWANVAIGIKR